MICKLTDEDHLSDQQGPSTHTLLMASIHELKNQFQTVHCQITKMKGDALNEAESNSFHRLTLEMNQINHRVHQMMTFFSMEKKVMRPHLDQHKLHDFFTTTVARHALTAKQHHFKFSQTVDPKLAGFFDASWLDLVMDTLIFNASPLSSHIQLSAYSKESGLCIEVQDDGPGFDQGKEQAVESKPLGSGLGLWLAEQLVQAHQHEGRRGHLKQLNPDSGACVQVWLP